MKIIVKSVELSIEWSFFSRDLKIEISIESETSTSFIFKLEIMIIKQFGDDLLFA